MAFEEILLPFFLFFTIATLYSSVGHAGASGYLAIMSLLSFGTESIKPISLILNIAVALIASVKFIRAGYFDRRIFLVFIMTSLPMAFLGGYLKVGPEYFKLFAGIFLIVSAIMLVAKQFIQNKDAPTKVMPIWVGLLLGAVIGLLSGLIGVGGGIFLSPILIMTNWTNVKNASGISALFILCNSASGLAGHITSLQKLDVSIAYWLVAVVIGGFLGSYLGTKKFNNKVIVGFLFLVLLTAGLKFVLVDFGK
ncbi:MAG: sulfite exporter TauE/SafE family protein [Bacteroidetes bacterium]|nr:sulfite exporter TauE/SafE family protein [Bacteroidota bacterium]